MFKMLCVSGALLFAAASSSAVPIAVTAAVGELSVVEGSLFSPPQVAGRKGSKRVGGKNSKGKGGKYVGGRKK
jgi:hypothetical protein